MVVGAIHTKQGVLCSGEIVAPSVDRRHFDSAFDQALAYLARREIRQRVLSAEQLETLREPVIARMQRGLLEGGGLCGFLVFVSQGGIPLSLLQRQPDLPLDGTLVASRGGGSLEPGKWLPPYLQERLVVPDTDLDIQQTRIITVLQSCMRQRVVDIPIFFIGSAAAPNPGMVSDLDVVTGSCIRRMHMSDCDQLFNLMRHELTADSRISGGKSHVGAVFDHLVLGIGVSVGWYGRALRVTPSQVYAIESSA